MNKDSNRSDKIKYIYERISKCVIYCIWPDIGLKAHCFLMTLVKTIF